MNRAEPMTNQACTTGIRKALLAFMLLALAAGCATRNANAEGGTMAAAVLQTVSCETGVCLQVRIENCTHARKSLPRGAGASNIVANSAFAFQGLNKEMQWNGIATEVGDYIIEPSPIVIDPGKAALVLVPFLSEMPTPWLYSKFRLVIKDVSAHEFLSNEFDSRGRPLGGHILQCGKPRTR